MAKTKKKLRIHRALLHNQRRYDAAKADLDEVFKIIQRLNAGMPFGDYVKMEAATCSLKSWHDTINTDLEG